MQMKTKISVLLVVALAVVAGCKYGVEGESDALRGVADTKMSPR